MHQIPSILVEAETGHNLFRRQRLLDYLALSDVQDALHVLCVFVESQRQDFDKVDAIGFQL